MKSKFKQLQCPCGCELAADHRLEVAYQTFVTYGYEVEGLVNCERTNTQLLFRVHDIHPDMVNKRLGALVYEVGFNVTVWYDQRAMVWLCDVAYKQGVMFA